MLAAHGREAGPPTRESTTRRGLFERSPADQGLDADWHVCGGVRLGHWLHGRPRPEHVRRFPVVAGRAIWRRPGGRLLEPCPPPCCAKRHVERPRPTFARGERYGRGQAVRLVVGMVGRHGTVDDMGMGLCPAMSPGGVAYGQRSADPYSHSNDYHVTLSSSLMSTSRAPRR